MHLPGGVRITLLVCLLLLVSGLSGCVELRETNARPLVGIASPSDGDVVFGMVNITGTASDSDGLVEKVEISVNHGHEVVMAWTAANGTATWHYHWNTRLLPHGTYTIFARSYDGTDHSGTATITVTVEQVDTSSFSIACWNLQRFGPTKASNDTLLAYYADVFDDYDLFIVQEITDASGTAIMALADKLPRYSYIISTRAGTTSYKEQYAIFYTSRATMVSQYDWTPEQQGEFERPPFQATFTVNNWTFTLYTIHTQPDSVSLELTSLENIIGVPTGDTIVIGDLNADGSYYDEDHRAHFTTWTWVISNDMDTTVAASDNTYDRIIINTAATNNFLSAGVMDEVTSSQSDHYLVYALFNANIP